jgi:hypothetical protein
MRCLLAWLLISTWMCGSEPWRPVGSPHLPDANAVATLMKMAYRSTAAGLHRQLSNFTPITCARVGDEVIVCAYESTTYRVDANGILEPFPISAEEVIAAPSPDERQRASLAVAAALCEELQLTSATMAASVDADGAWSICWETSRNGGQGLKVTKGENSLPGDFYWGRGRSCGGVILRCGGVQRSTPPTGSG